MITVTSLFVVPTIWMMRLSVQSIILAQRKFVLRKYLNTN